VGFTAARAATSPIEGMAFGFSAIKASTASNTASLMRLERPPGRAADLFFMGLSKAIFVAFVEALH
jgi:hypothetical protein